MRPSLTYLSLTDWQSFVESHPDSTAFHHRRWIELIAEHYGWKVHVPALVHGDEIETAVPMVETKNVLGKKKLISLPFTDCVPMLRGSEQSVTDLLARLEADPKFRRHSAVVLRWDKPVEGYDGECSSYRHVLKINRPWKDLEGGFSRTILRNVRRAHSCDLAFHRRTDEESIKIFYDLHVMTRRKLGVPVQPKSFFLQLYDKILANDLGYVGIVEHDHRPIAAAVFLTFNKTTMYKYGASDPTQLRTRPNEFLFHNAIRYASEMGFSHFDFGITAKANEGLRSFKQKWGPDEGEAHHVYVVGKPSQSNTQTSRALALSAVVIRHAPPSVCRALGQAFYRFSQ